MATVRSLLLSTLVLAAAAPTATAGQLPARDEGRPGVLSRYHPVARAFSFDQPQWGTLPNGAAHTQDMVLTHGDWQYLGFWDDDRRLAVGRRMLPDGPWEFVHFDDYRILGQDSHNAVSIGACPGDGTLHLSFDHHGDDLHYRRSAAGLLDDPLGTPWTAASFGPVVSVLDPAHGTVTRVTYPRFLTTPSGDVQFVYREFGSGDGRARLVDYSAATGAWANDRVFIERTGPHDDPLGGRSESRNPYFNRIDYDAFGTLHATWTWRERAPIRYNRDIAYAYSEDGGVVWFNSDHEEIADTSAGGVIDAASPGVNVVELGAEWGLMNDQGHVVDTRGRVHVVMYHKDQPDTQVSYGNVFNSHYRHFWRSADGTWRSSWLTTMGNRPKLLSDEHGRIVLLYKDGGDLVADGSSAYGDFLDWSTFFRWRGGFGSSAQADVARFQETGILSVAMQDRVATPGDDSWVGLVDFAPAAFAAPLRVDRERRRSVAVPTERDAYVRGGAYADQNFGFETSLQVRDAGNADDDRLGFLRFHLAELDGGGVIESAVLRLSVGAAGAEWGLDGVALRRCAQDIWWEGSINWNNRPVSSGSSFPGPGGGSIVDIDVTPLVAQELANGGQRLTFELAGTTTGPERWVDFHSREAGAALAPTLHVEQVNALRPIADAHVRGGVHAGTNFGADDRLIVKESANDDFDRVAYLRFDLSPLAGTGNLSRVFLDARSPTMGNLGATTPCVAHFVAEDAWDEHGITWDQSPTLGPELDTHFGRPALRWDVTDRVLAELQGDEELTIAIRSDREGAPRTIHLWPREAAIGANAPRLVVRYD